MASIKATFGALLGTVTSSATVITSTLNAASTGAEMLNQYAEMQSKQQRKDYAAMEILCDEMAEDRVAKAQAERLREIKALNLSAEEQVLFLATKERVRVALASVK